MLEDNLMFSFGAGAGVAFPQAFTTSRAHDIVSNITFPSGQQAAREMTGNINPSAVPQMAVQSLSRT